MPLLKQAGHGSVGLQMRGVYHQAFSRSVLSGQLAEYLVEDSLLAPVHKTVVERLVRP